MWLVGEPSIAAFDAALPGLFVDVVAIEKWPAVAAEPEVSGVLVPSLHSPSADAGLIAQDIQYRLVYRMQPFSRTGEALGDWNVIGIAGRSPHDVSLVQPSSLVQDVFRSAAAALIASFFIDPHARSWLEANGVSPDAMR